jgi:hypothetical protein
MPTYSKGGSDYAIDLPKFMPEATACICGPGTGA